jgi:hypothetical protein
MVKKLLVFGDSFCHGIGPISVFKDKSGTEKAFGKYIVDELDLEYVNLAAPGRSIIRATQIGYQYIPKNRSEIDAQEQKRFAELFVNCMSLS